ncbi:MAG: hypothetical protein K2X25_08350 [Caulobacteraceae bacterium]|nr:hypothetical protein [Caulobacteraceae bacterium]
MNSEASRKTKTTRRELSFSESVSAYADLASDYESKLKDLRLDSKMLGSEVSLPEDRAGPGDAFRHAVASALMTCQHGAIVSLAAGIAYEARNVGDYLTNMPFSDLNLADLSRFAQEVGMDLYNDWAGLKPSICTEGRTKSEIGRLIAHDISAGRMIMLQDGKYVDTMRIREMARPDLVQEPGSTTSQERIDLHFRYRDGGRARRNQAARGTLYD